MKNGNLTFILNIVLSALFLCVTVCVIVPASRSWETRLRVFFYGDACETEDESVSQTENPSEPPVTDPTEPEQTTLRSDSRKEPEEVSDLKTMQEEYAEKFAGMEPCGSVSEEFMATKGATDILGGVAVKNSTATKKPDFEALLEAGAPIEKADFSEPTVLIFHTHTTESYLQVDDGVFYKDYETRSADPGRNMVRVGDELCRVLEENGVGVIHDTNIYDEYYNGAYARSRKTVLEYLEKYPSIQIVLDVHRDAIYYSDTVRCKPTAVIGGEKAAQVMIITGAEEGQITDFPDWEENLKFALALQKEAQEKYEGLMRPVYFCQRKYNMDTAKCSLLLEIGSDANTLEEACRSARMIGEALCELIRNKE